LPTSDFNDVTTGDNGYSAGEGYDLATGLGTPVANLLVTDLATYAGSTAAPAGRVPLSAAGATLSDTAFNLIHALHDETNAFAVVNVEVVYGGAVGGESRSSALLGYADESSALPLKNSPLEAPQSTGDSLLSVRPVAIDALFSADDGPSASPTSLDSALVSSNTSPTSGSMSPWDAIALSVNRRSLFADSISVEEDDFGGELGPDDFAEEGLLVDEVDLSPGVSGEKRFVVHREHKNVAPLSKVWANDMAAVAADAVERSNDVRPAIPATQPSWPTGSSAVSSGPSTAIAPAAAAVEDQADDAAAFVDEAVEKSSEAAQELYQAAVDVIHSFFG
jgi:hypothetical protein